MYPADNSLRVGHSEPKIKDFQLKDICHITLTCDLPIIALPIIFHDVHKTLNIQYKKIC